MKAFTLIETMVSVTILMLVATGIIFSLGNSLRATAGSDATIQAQLLAEEGVELVRAIKDANTLYYSNTEPKHKSIFENITRTVGSGSQDMCLLSACYIDDKTANGIPRLTEVFVATEPLTGGTWFSQIKKDGTTFNRTFTRTVKLLEINDDINVTVSVVYDKKNITYSTLLTKWYVNQP